MQEFSTPMMQQYTRIKKEHQDCLLFFRLGDFYELFLEDAKVGANVLNITLTKRPRGKDGDIPMAGVPYHSADSYIAKLVKDGFKVAICEQVSEPDSKGIVDREVVRIVTPGTILDEKSLERKEHNYTMSLSLGKNSLGIAISDISTGDFQTTELIYENNLRQVLGNELARFSPAECILSEKDYQEPELINLLRLPISGSKTDKGVNIYCFLDWEAWTHDPEKVLKKHFQIKTLAGFQIDDKQESQKAASALLGYLNQTQKKQVSHIQSLRTWEPEHYVVLDRSTLTNLEVFATLRTKDYQGSLISVLDKTTTAMGGRLLRTWLRKPLRDKSKIEARLEAVSELKENYTLRQNLRDKLKNMYDIERIVSRLSVGIGNAVDLINLKNSLCEVLEVDKLLNYKDRSSTPSTGSRTPVLLKDIKEKMIENVNKIVTLIDKRIENDPPIDLKQGNLIKPKINNDLDTLRRHVLGDKNWIATQEIKERRRSGINSLKIKFNKVFGYYIEISKSNLESVPADYFRRQTMTNAERFITPELKKYEEKILSAEEKINALEYRLFQKTVEDVLAYLPNLQQTAGQIAVLDCLLSLAQVAEKERYSRPEVVEGNKGKKGNEGDKESGIEIKNGRHLVVEKLLSNSQFAPNDVVLNQHDHQLLILTGPNMAGKSVFIRQVALITLLVHIGSFVPAEVVKISLIDRLFVRSGASDMITSGLSTFMVEMVETAYILHHATDKSLIIMDEIGRGTSTYDGISIAWAVAEFLVTQKGKQAKTLFATHYRELQALEMKYSDKIKNYHLAVQEKNNKPIFLHKVTRGSASSSYGVSVARLAGVPDKVVKKAQKLLIDLENKDTRVKIKAKPSELRRLSLESSEEDKTKQKIKKQLEKIDITHTTPLEALNILAKMKKRIGKNV